MEHEKQINWVEVRYWLDWFNFDSDTTISDQPVGHGS